ncbi:MAG: YbgF trimerization domain-containing protein [Pseudomonadota bacterium]
MLKQLFTVILSVVALGSIVPVASAQVRVIDSSPQSVRSGVNRHQESIEQKTEAYNQVQSLQQEVSELRSLVEEQGHELSRLKQQQLDNYVDLDRRVAILSTASKVPVAESSIESPPSPSSLSSDANVSDSGELGEAEEYKAAYDLLRQRQVDASLLAFKQYLKKYPSGDFAGNSYYWLGEIFLLKNQLPQARESFAKLIEGFPSSNKVPDAKFKLGKVYHLMGDKIHAKSMLNEAAAGSGDSARLATQYLKDNF